MGQRPDSAIYQAALAELRERHWGEFEGIRQRLLSEAGLIGRSRVQRPRGRSLRTLELCGRVLRLIEREHARCGRAPAPVEISRAIGIPCQVARYIVLALEADGRIVREGPERTIRVVSESEELAS